MNDLVTIATGVIASNDMNVDLAVDIKTRIVSGLHDKKLGEIPIKRKNQAKTFAKMRKSVKVGKTVVQTSSDGLIQRSLASVM